MHGVGRGGMGRGGRGNIRPLMSVASSGPLRTDQYQGLEDIDLELELLKRKREIIEKQQQMLALRSFDYPSGQNEENRFDEFLHLYENKGAAGGSRKRQIPVWDHEPHTKRFAAAPPSRRPEPPRPQPRLRPRPAPAAAAAAASRSDRHPARAPRTDEDVLRSDRPPSRQLAGRLELALGYIFKDLKTEYPEHDDLLRKSKVVKQVIRERIRQTMLGKHVPTAEAIKAMYRAQYPTDTDHDLVLKAIEAHTGKEFIPTDAEDPELYFMRNISRLMSNKLEEMFGKLRDLYRAEYPDAATSLNKPETSKSGEEEKHDEKTKKIIESIVSTRTYQALDRLMTVKLAQMIKKYIPTITKLLNVDGQYRKLVASIKCDTKRRFTGETSQTTVKANTNDTTAKPEGEKPPYQPLPYFVKLMGKPTLPKRKAMESFFEKYKPQVIKKHRNVHNLLFVGFANKESYERILTADGTVVGRFTLSIRVSERQQKLTDSKTGDACANESADASTNANESNNANANESTNADSKESINASVNESANTTADKNSSSSVLDSALDQQISNLLTSIRNNDGTQNNETIVIDEDEQTTDVKVENVTINDDAQVDGEEQKCESNAAESGQNEESNLEKLVKNEKEQNNVGEAVQNEEKPTETNETGQNSEAGDVQIDKEHAEDSTLDKTQLIDEDQLLKEPTDEKESQPETKTDETQNPVTDEKQVGENNCKNDEITEINEKMEANDTVAALKANSTGRSTPTRSSARIATTPSTIRTRRASRLAQADNSK